MAQVSTGSNPVGHPIHLKEIKMPRKNPVHKSYHCEGNGQVYRGKSIKGAKKLDKRIKEYESYVQHASDGGKGFKKPGSIKK